MLHCEVVTGGFIGVIKGVDMGVVTGVVTVKAGTEAETHIGVSVRDWLRGASTVVAGRRTGEKAVRCHADSCSSARF